MERGQGPKEDGCGKYCRIHCVSLTASLPPQMSVNYAAKESSFQTLEPTKCFILVGASAHTVRRQHTLTMTAQRSASLAKLVRWSITLSRLG
jgi:hypothetical protein